MLEIIGMMTIAMLWNLAWLCAGIIVLAMMVYTVACFCPDDYATRG